MSSTYIAAFPRYWCMKPHFTSACGDGMQQLYSMHCKINNTLLCIVAPPLHYNGKGKVMPLLLQPESTPSSLVTGNPAPTQSSKKLLETKAYNAFARCIIFFNPDIPGQHRCVTCAVRAGRLYSELLHIT